jgi:hypothetical protein
MATDPESVWHYGPTVDFNFPEIPQTELLHNYCASTFGRNVAPADLEWLGNLISGYLNWLGTDCTDYNQFRLAALQLVRVLRAIDSLMVEARDKERCWEEISLALALPSAEERELTLEKIGRRYGLTKMAISKSVSKLIRLAQLKPRPRGYNGSQISC